MKNINFLIEKACIDYCEQVDSVYNEKDVFQAGAHFALSLFKWRKVSEGLPEWDGKKFTLITKKIGEYGITYNIFPIHSEKSILFMKDLSDEWMPIPQID